MKYDYDIYDRRLNMKCIMLNRYEHNIDNRKSLCQILFPKYDKGGLDTINDGYFNSVNI